MSAVEETIKEAVEPAEDKPLPRSVRLVEHFVKFLDRIIKLLSSVRLGVVLLSILVTLSIIGMIVLQQNVEGFEAYYAGLTPSEKLLGSWLGVFDIYRSWYFSGLLLVLSLNIILASIDHFPGALNYITKKKLTASPLGLSGQPCHAVVEMPGASESEIVELL